MAIRDHLDKPVVKVNTKMLIASMVHELHALKEEGFSFQQLHKAFADETGKVIQESSFIQIYSDVRRENGLKKHQGNDKK